MNVKAVIKERGYTIERVAKDMGVTRVTLSQTLSRNPTIATLRRIAGVLGCGVGEFFRDEMEPTSGALLRCPHCGKTIHITIDK